MGVATTQCSTEIFFEKNEYYLGETARVRVVCDNSACDKPVKSFKFKLHRHHEGRANDKNTISSKKYLFENKEAGCPAKTKVDVTFELQIPTEDAYFEEIES